MLYKFLVLCLFAATYTVIAMDPPFPKISSSRSVAAEKQQDISAMDCPQQKVCYMQKVFDRKPLADQEKSMLLELLRTSPLILDENQNTVLHMAAAIKEWPDLISHLLELRPEVAAYIDSPNKQEVTPTDLVSHLKVKPFSRPPIVQVSTPEAVTKPTPVDLSYLDRSIAYKLASSQNGQSTAPFSPLEKMRILQTFKDISLSEKGNNPLHMAAGITNYPELTEQLIKENPRLIKDIDYINLEGFTPLGIAYIKGNNAAVQALLNAGANPKLG